MPWVEIEFVMEHACFEDGKRGHVIGIPKLVLLIVFVLQYDEVLGKREYHGLTKCV